MLPEVNITYSTGAISRWPSAKHGESLWWAVLQQDAIFAPRWHRVKRHANGCWLLQMAGSNKAGHVLLSRPGTRERIFAHRHAYALAFGRVPTGRVVRHRCDDPACVNPAHLLVGTQHDNIHDCIQRDRRNAWGRQRLIIADVLDIRARFGAGETQRAIAAAYGVSKGCIHSVVRRLTWGHVATIPASPFDRLRTLGAVPGGDR